MPRKWDNKEYYAEYFAAKESIHRLRREFLPKKPQEQKNISREPAKKKHYVKQAFGPDR